jgi:xanthine dehydrogenase YagT iron-sulfur-binding subunit
MATTATAIASPIAIADAESTQEPETRPIPGAIPVTLKVNGETYRVQIDPRATVLDSLRDTLDLTGTKKGCDHGQCGACTVHIRGRRANSYLLFAAMQQNAEITTIEGLGTPERMHPVQAAFVEHDGLPVWLLYQRPNDVCRGHVACSASDPPRASPSGSLTERTAKIN